MASFEVGAEVVYPLHGAGMIEAIESKEMLGERQDYYILNLAIGSMTVMVPVAAAEKSGLRGVVAESDLHAVFDVLQGEQDQMSSNWNRRYRANTEKLKTGDIYELAEVVRNLTIRDREKGLASTELTMLDTARQALVSELMLAKKIDEHACIVLLNQVLKAAGESAD